MPIINMDDDEDDNIVPVEEPTSVIENTPNEIVEVHTYKTQEELKTSTMFNKDVPLKNIIANVSGMDWEVEYFSQLRGINDQPQLPDVKVSNTVLKYNRISKMVIKLQSAINQSNAKDITGEAIINSGIVPSYGDPFIATLTGGREAIFVISEVTKNTYNLHNIYNVSFKLHIFLDKNSEFYNDLVFKTMSEYVYDKKHLENFSSPVILKGEYHEKLELRRQPIEILNYYMDHMVNTENNVIAAPTQASIYIDTLLTSFLNKITNHDDSEKFIKINKIDYETKTKDSVWDALIKRSITVLKRVERKIGFKYTPSSISNPEARHVSYLGIRFITDKTDSRLQVDFLENEDLGNYTPPVNVSENYIFSDGFYNGDPTDPTTTDFEKMVLQYLRGEIIDDDVLDKYVREYPIWNREHQFYLLPVLILLIKSNINNAFSSL